MGIDLEAVKEPDATKTYAIICNIDFRGIMYIWGCNYDHVTWYYKNEHNLYSCGKINHNSVMQIPYIARIIHNTHALILVVFPEAMFTNLDWV